MANAGTTRRILRYEILGFAIIILVSWVDELLSLPSLLFGSVAGRTNWKEALLETLIVLCVAVPVTLQTRVLLSRLRTLEGFLRICAWCRKIEHEGQWIVLEEFFVRRLDTATTHGMCPSCAAKMEQQVVNA